MIMNWVTINAIPKVNFRLVIIEGSVSLRVFINIRLELLFTQRVLMHVRNLVSKAENARSKSVFNLN